MMNKKTIILIVLLILFSVAIYQGFLKKEKPTFTLAEVVRGNISQEVSETGQVKQGDEVKLSFKNAGKIEKIYVAVGEEVKEGDVLAKLETNQVSIQLQEARASLSLSQAQLNKLLAGVSQEEIKIAQTEVANSQIALDSANQTLKDANEDALNVLDDVSLKAYNSQNTADAVQRTYFNGTDQESIKVKENTEEIKKAASQIKFYFDETKINSSQEEIDSTLSKAKNELSKISNSLKIIREACEVSVYRSSVSSADKTSIDTQRTNINTAITNLSNAQQSIVSAELSIDGANGQLQTARDNLAKITAPPRDEDVDYYQSQVDKARAQAQILESQIREASLRSPVAGKITGIKKRIGELTQPVSQDVVITLLAAVPFEITADIYEEDVVKISVGNDVEISLVAFPEKIYKGKVLSIEPAEKLIEGVVYYEVRITFEEVPEGVKPGMTTDIVIKTAQRENVLIAPQDAFQKKDGKTMVEVLKGDKIEEREVEIGLKGSNNKVEVVSGLKEGEKVIIR